MQDIKTLHQQIIKEIADERTKEMAEFVAAKRRYNEGAAKRLTQGLEQLKSVGIDPGKFNALHQALDADRANELKAIKAKYAADSNLPKSVAPEDTQHIALDAAIVARPIASLPPAYAAVFSTKDQQDKLAGGTGTDVPNPNIIDAWDWASGAGTGWFGSGAGSYQVWAEWGFWYNPPENKFYSIVPHNVFRGFYIVRSDDGFFTSKYARAVVSIWTNVWQYNWKGWNTVNVLDVGSDNIDTNQRFDNDRHTYNAALLGGGDWAYIRNVVGLYVYARGGGSYAELNFATGAANYLACPHVHIY